MKTLSRYLLLFLLAVIPAAAFAADGVLTLNFSTPVQLAPSETPGFWYPDRYAPSTFVSPATAPDGTRNALEEGIALADYQGPDSFYNIQGRKYDLPGHTVSTTIEVYVPKSWATNNSQMAGFWGTVFDSTGAVGDYPIIEFQGNLTTPDLVTPYTNNGVPGFYGWNNVTGSYNYIGLPTNFKYNSWVELTMTLIPGKGFEYTVSEPSSHHGVSILSPLSDPLDVSFGNVILEGYNNDASYSFFWNNLSASFTSSVCVQ
jgi:hypothetical protein